MQDILLNRLGEDELLSRLLAVFPTPSDTSSLVQGPGDDCAVARRDDRWDTLLKTDAVVEGIHFSIGTDPRLIGRKALARAVSDIAAMGGIPELALVNLFLSENRRTSIPEWLNSPRNFTSRSPAEKFPPFLMTVSCSVSPSSDAWNAVAPSCAAEDAPAMCSASRVLSAAPSSPDAI